MDDYELIERAREAARVLYGNERALIRLKEAGVLPDEAEFIKAILEYGPDEKIRNMMKDVAFLIAFEIQRLTIEEIKQNGLTSKALQAFKTVIQFLKETKGGI